jgi:hypothetical protein
MGTGFALRGLVVLFAAAAVVTALGGGVDDPRGGTCTAGSSDGCNPEAGVLHIFGEKRCVVLAGPGWAPSKCTDPKAIAADDADQPALPDVPQCGVGDIDAVLATIRTLESGGRYTIGPNAGGASGAYQFIQGTWNGVAKRVGRSDLVGRGPWTVSPADQDALARQLVAEAMGGTDDIGRVPVVWYIGHVPVGGEWDVVPHPEAGNRATPRQYQAAWMGIYRRISGACAGGAA